MRVSLVLVSWSPKQVHRLSQRLGLGPSKKSAGTSAVSRSVKPRSTSISRSSSAASLSNGRKSNPISEGQFHSKVASSLSSGSPRCWSPNTLKTSKTVNLCYSLIKCIKVFAILTKFDKERANDEMIPHWRHKNWLYSIYRTVIKGSSEVWNLPNP